MSTKSHVRLAVLYVLVISLVVTLFGRLWYLQILTGERYAHAAAENRTREVIVPAVRGQIYDDVGRPLVRNRAALVVSVDRSRLAKEPDGGKAVLHRLAKVLDMPYKEIQEKIRICGRGVSQPCWQGSPYQPIPVTDKADTKVALQIMERHEDFPGVSAQVQGVRTYPTPDGANAAHILGYLGPITDEELKQRKGAEKLLSGTDLVGRGGLEATYEQYLRGTPGAKTVAVDSMGEVTGTVSQTAPTPGNSLVTSIDAKVQHDVEEAVADAVHRAQAEGKPSHAAAGVVLDVRTGHVVGMASYPSYDSSVWVNGISQKDYQKLRDSNALVAQATQGRYSPGSTFKPISTAAAVEDGFPLHGIYPCPSSVQVGNRAFHNFESEALGPINFHEALVFSCDTVYYGIAYKMWQRDGGTHPGKHPKDPITSMAKAFGLDEATGIDLPSESSSRVSGREWKKQYWKATKDYYCKHAKTGFPDVEKTDPARADYLKRLSEENCKGGYVWRPGDAANLSIGQGDTVVTPLALARAYAALANGGTVFEPRIGKAIVRPDGTLVKKIKAPKAGELPVDDETLSYIRDALADVTTQGTGAGAFAGFPQDEVRVAGKTGTAEAQGEEDTSWFASFGPVDHPRYAVVVMVANSGQGAHFAAPAVRAIWEGIYGLGGHGKAALPDGEPPKSLPRFAEDGTVGPPHGFPAAFTAAPTIPDAPEHSAGVSAALPALAPDRRPSEGRP